MKSPLNVIDHSLEDFFGHRLACDQVFFFISKGKRKKGFDTLDINYGSLGSQSRSTSASLILQSMDVYIPRIFHSRFCLAPLLLNG